METMSQYNTNFLHPYNETTLGPIQGDEALFLYGLCKMVRPQIVLEIGSLIGQSLRVWINAGVPFIYAVDALISEPVKELQRGQGTNGMLCFEQDMTAPIDFVRGIPDLVFVDASHRLEDNIAVVKNLVNVLGSGALVIFHDTGHRKDEHVPENDRWILSEDKWDEELQAWVLEPDEKETIEWISQNTNWQRIDLWTTVVPRCGLTVFQVPN
jgi:predicted O-methyltransferase YrrM